MMLYSRKTNSNGLGILFVHGNSHSSDIWSDVVGQDLLLKNYELITVDLPGHGNSFKSNTPEQDYSVRGMASHLKAFIEQLNLEQYIVVAHSIGTNLVAEVVGELNNCKGLFLLSPCVVGDDIDVKLMLKPNPYLSPAFTPEPAAGMLLSYTRNMVCKADEVVTTKWVDVFNSTDPAFRQCWAESFTRGECSDQIKHLAQATQPIAIAFGAKEKFIDNEYLNNSGIKLWQNEVLTVPNAAHCVQLDEPEELTALIAGFAAHCYSS
jgi:pimeloyl-ACP methyl ester carboxylesterase